MKIYAKQVPPEYQGWPFDHITIEEMYPGVILYGNRWYNGHTTPEFDAIIERFDGKKRILRALHLVTGKRYEKRTIRGYCQGDWQEVYFPIDDYSPEAIRELEIEYFNLGTEWDITSDDDSDSFSVYCYGTSCDEIKKEIADATGVNPENITMYEFTGWSRSAEYMEV